MEASWINIAVLSAALLGLVNIFDSHLISRRMPSFQVYLLVVSPVILISGIVFAFLYPLPANLSAWQLLVAVGAGLLRAVSVIILLYTLKKEEVSRAIPVVAIYPIFVATMAIPLLGEVLTGVQIAAIAAVVVGAVVVSARRIPGRPTKWLGAIFFLLLASSLLLALADLASKYALSYLSSWNIYWISILVLSMITLLLSLRRHSLWQLSKIKQPGTSLALVALNETLVVTGALLFFWAMERGPVSLVSTIAATRPVFVLIYVILLSRLRPAFLLEKMGRTTLVIRLAATALITGGIAMIYLT
jgi:uncharacterized membrane protein